MSWFDEQIRQRKLSDQELFEDSCMLVADAVLNSRTAAALRDGQVAARSAMGEILRFFGKRPGEVPEDVTDFDEQLEYLLRPHGIMRRVVALEQGWYRDAFGPMLAVLKEDGSPVALLPTGLAGYTWLDRKTGRRRLVNAETAKLFEPEGLCFYRPLPLRPLKVRDLLLYVRGCFQLGDLLLYLSSMLALTLVGMLLPLLVRMLMGKVVDSGSYRLLGAVAIFIACVAVSSQLISTVQGLLLQRLRMKMDLSVQAAAMMRILSLPTRFFRQFSSGEVSARTQSIQNLCGVIVNSVLSTSFGAVFSLLYIGQIFAFAPSLVIPALVIIALTVALSVITVTLQTRITREHMEHAAKDTGLSYALITGVQKLRLAGAEQRAFARWATHYAEGARLSYNPPLFLKLHTVLNLAVQLLGTIVFYYLAVKTGVSREDYFAFNSAYGMVAGAFAATANLAMTYAQIRPILDMARPILAAEPEDAGDRAMVTRLRGGIELNNVCFRYAPERPWVVDGMSLRIRAGEYVGVVGSTGCGKSTLVRLLLGFEKPERGVIFYDGKDMSRLDLKSLRARLGVVAQNDRLFQGSIFENIAISCPELTLDGAWEAAKIAGIADDIRAMPMGMQTVIGEGQGGISGGQRQRLLIARAVAGKPKVLIFDEATSALDNKTQKQVSEALDALQCTRIVVAHRLSTIRHCDRILVLDKGKIIEEGNYDALIAKGGVFAALVERQRL